MPTAALRQPPTYRVQVRPDFALKATAETRRLPRRPRRQPPLHRAAADRDARLGARLRRGRPPRRSTRSSAARRAGAAGRRAGARPGWAWSSTSCPTTPGSPYPRPTRPGGTCCKHGARTRRTRTGSTSTGPAAGCCCRCSADDPDALDDLKVVGRRAALLRQALPDRRRHRRGQRPRGARPAALRAGQLDARRRRAELPPVLRHRRPGRAARRGPGGLRRHPRRDPALVRRGRGAGHPGRPPGRPARPRRLPAAGCTTPRRTPGWWWRRSSNRGEELPDWPVDGTTGYDALSEVCGVFVDPGTEAFFDTLDHHLTGGETSWQDLVHQTKLHVATTLLAAELARLARLAPEIDATPPTALAELAACFPVYRSYLPFGARHLAKARSEAGRRRPHLIRGAGPAHRAAAQPGRRAGRSASSSSPAR